MIQGKAPPASSNAFPGNRVGSAPSLSQSHQLVSRQRQDTEHQMPHDFGGTLNPEGVATEFALESRIAALGHGALVETDRISRLEFFFRAAAWIMVNQRHMIQASAKSDRLLGSVDNQASQITEAAKATKEAKRSASLS